MSCDLIAPQTSDAFFSLINTCAEAVGGPHWIYTAMLGALVPLGAMALFLIVVIARRSR